MSVSDFKARCLELVETARSEGRRYVITKHGRPVARLVPIQEASRSPRGRWKGLVQVTGDIVHGDWADLFEATKA